MILIIQIYANTMKINNWKAVAIAMYGFFFLILMDILFLAFSKQFFNLNKTTLYGCFLVILIFSLWQIIKLKSFSIEVSEHIFSLKYNHPLFRSQQPSLEVPLSKIISLKTEKGILNSILIISVNTKRGIRNFYYDVGKLPSTEPEKFKNLLDFMTDSYFSNDNKFQKA